jgi:hypothetical protein
MNVQENLWAFDQLARQKGIDTGLKSAANERQDTNSDYAISVEPDSPPARRRCLLTIQNRLATKFLLGGSFEVSAGSGETVYIKRSYLWTNDGKPFDVVLLKTNAITEAEITRLALDFIDNFFEQVEAQAK